MSAGQSQGLARNFIGMRGGEKVFREFVLKRGIVAPADGEEFLARASQFRQIRNGADGRPVTANFILRDFRAQRFPNVNRGEAGGNNVAEIRRNMQKRGGADERFVRRRDARDTRTEARSQDAERAVAALSEPLQAASRVANGLTIRLQSQTDIGADDVVCLRMARHGSAVVIRQTQSKCGEFEAVQPAANVNVRRIIGVPLRQNYYSRADFAGGEKTRVDAIVFLPRRLDGAREREACGPWGVRCGFEMIIECRFAGEPRVAIR